MEEETNKKWTLWLVALLVVIVLAIVALTRLEAGALLLSSFAENPKAFFAAWAIAIVFVICAVGFARASIKMLKEVSEEMDKRNKK